MYIYCIICIVNITKFHQRFLVPIVAATAVSVCLIPKPLMKALVRVITNTIT